MEGTEEKPKKSGKRSVEPLEEPQPEDEDFTYVDLEDEKSVPKPEIKVNLDSPYFKRMRDMKKP